MYIIELTSKMFVKYIFKFDYFLKNCNKLSNQSNYLIIINLI